MQVAPPIALQRANMVSVDTFLQTQKRLSHGNLDATCCNKGNETRTLANLVVRLSVSWITWHGKYARYGLSFSGPSSLCFAITQVGAVCGSVSSLMVVSILVGVAGAFGGVRLSVVTVASDDVE